MPELVPVDHDPFLGSGPVLVPVDHNPFVDDATAAAFPETVGNPGIDVAVRGVAKGLSDFVTTPGTLANTPNPYPPGSEESIEFERTRQQAGDSWARNAALATMGTGAVAGLPVNAGEAVLGAGPIRAYHGSPYNFDKFDSSKIGTGEGAQAYGHGTYLAEAEDTAKTYRDALKNRGLIDTSLPMDDPRRIAGELYDSWQGDINGALDDAKHYDNSKNVIAELNKIHANPPTGHMYEVNINADPEHFVDWDKPLSEQSDYVKNAVAKVDSSLSSTPPSLTTIKDPEIRSIVRRALKENEGQAQGLELAIDNDSGLYNAAVNHAKRNKIDLDAQDMRASDYIYQQAKNYIDSLHASQNLAGDSLGKALGVKGADMMQSGPAAARLRDAGIPGIKYLDQGSRASGEGSRNYVVFDDKLIDILRKYGVAGISMLPPATAAVVSQHLIPVDHDPFAQQQGAPAQ